jgi:SAP domain
MMQLEFEILGVTNTEKARYDETYFCPKVKKHHLPEEERFYRRRAVSQQVPLRYHALDVTEAPTWTFLPTPSVESTTNLGTFRRARREAEEEAVLEDIERVANAALVRTSHRFEAGQEILSRAGRTHAETVGSLDLTKLTASKGTEGYKIADLKAFCHLEGLPISGNKGDLRERLMRAKGLLPPEASQSESSTAGRRRHRGGSRLSPSSRLSWARGVISQVEGESRAQIDIGSNDEASESDSVESEPSSHAQQRTHGPLNDTSQRGSLEHQVDGQQNTSNDDLYIH